PPVGDRAGEEIGITREHEPAAPALTAGKMAIVLGGRLGRDIAGLGRGNDGMKRRVGRHDALSRTYACESVTRHALEEPFRWLSGRSCFGARGTRTREQLLLRFRR